MQSSKTNRSVVPLFAHCKFQRAPLKCKELRATDLISRIYNPLWISFQKGRKYTN